MSYWNYKYKDRLEFYRFSFILLLMFAITFLLFGIQTPLDALIYFLIADISNYISNHVNFDDFDIDSGKAA
jgi:hypothetical protein